TNKKAAPDAARGRRREASRQHRRREEPRKCPEREARPRIRENSSPGKTRCRPRESLRSPQARDPASEAEAPPARRERTPRPGSAKRRTPKAADETSARHRARTTRHRGTRARRPEPFANALGERTRAREAARTNRTALRRRATRCADRDSRPFRARNSRPLRAETRNCSRKATWPRR